MLMVHLMGQITLLKRIYNNINFNTIDMNLEKEAREFDKTWTCPVELVGNAKKFKYRFAADFTKQTAPKLRYNEKGEFVKCPNGYVPTNLVKEPHTKFELMCKAWEDGKTPEQLFSEIALYKRTSEKLTNDNDDLIELNKQLKEENEKLKQVYSHRCNEVKDKVETIHKYLSELKQLKEENERLKTALENQKNQTADNRELWEESELKLHTKDKELKELKGVLKQDIKIYFMELDPTKFNSSNYVAGKGVAIYGTVDKDGNTICLGEFTQDETKQLLK